MTNTVQIQKPRDPAISLTAAALDHIEQYIAKQADAIGLRLSLTKTGCSGMSYVVKMIETPVPGDWSNQITPKVAVYVDPESVQYLRGTTIDYIKEGLNAHFVFNNPNEDSRCGCGESFNIKE